MSETNITLPVGAETAQVPYKASEEDREKLRLLLRLRLRELVGVPPGSLADIMDDIGAKAQAKGLTPEIMGALLRDD
ncbi:MAG: hypothetical protein V2B18_08820 [Pseudomonadota bacterium]